MKKLFIFFVFFSLPTFLWAHNYTCHYPKYGKFQIFFKGETAYLETGIGLNDDVEYNFYRDGLIFVINYENGPIVVTVEKNGNSVLTENYIDTQTSKIKSGKYLGKCLTF